MVGHERVKFAVVFRRKVLLADDTYVHLQIAHCRLQPLHAALVAVLPDEGVHLVLVYNLLEPFHKQARHVASLAAQLAVQYLFDVDRLFCYLIHKPENAGCAS